MSRQIPFAPDLSLTRKILAGTDLKPYKILARTVIEGGRVLSVPVAGGSGILKHATADPDKILISGHGRWRQEHLGAINAIYGKTPYFTHIFPEIKRIYDEKSYGTLGEFNRSLFDFVVDFLNIESLRPSINEMKTRNPSRFRQLKMEFERKVNINYSIFDALFRLGKNTAFVIFDD